MALSSFLKYASQKPTVITVGDWDGYCVGDWSGTGRVLVGHCARSERPKKVEAGGSRWSNGGRPGGSFSVATVGKSFLAKLRAGCSQGLVASEVFVNVWASSLEERRWPRDRTWKKKSKQNEIDSVLFLLSSGPSPSHPRLNVDGQRGVRKQIRWCAITLPRQY